MKRYNMGERKYDLNRDVAYGFPAHAPIPEAMLRDGKLPESKTLRHRGSRRSFTHDYCARGYYMITATTLLGAPTLSYIPDFPFEELRKDEMILPELSELGERIETEILNIPKYHPEIKILRFVIMPDHIHIVIGVMERLKKKLGYELAGFFSIS